MNLQMDLLAGAGLVKRTEGGSGNMEQFGSALSLARRGAKW